MAPPPRRTSRLPVPDRDLKERPAPPPVPPITPPITPHISPPASRSELLERASSLAGHSLADLANRLGARIPRRSTAAKGWAGQLVEILLGATAGSSPEPDFSHLGIELKTIPIDPSGKPRESTHVCVAPLLLEPGSTWKASLVRAKLARVLWVPILWPPGASIGERLVCTPVDWVMTELEEGVLRADWEELTELIALGRVQEITAHHGTALQLRPKATTASTTTWTTDPSGRRVPANPRGFYLRTHFTQRILTDAFQH